MKQLIIILTALWSLSAVAAPAISDLPDDACDSMNCTKNMKAILSGFNNTPHSVSHEPAVYSGGCYHLGNLDPEHEQYAAMMIDQNDEGTTYLSTIFAYYYPENPYANWDLARGRQEATDFAKKNSFVKEGSDASRVVIYNSQGGPAVIYYMRQDPTTQTIYLITYGGFGPDSTKIFCTMKKNP